MATSQNYELLKDIEKKKDFYTDQFMKKINLFIDDAQHSYKINISKIKTGENSKHIKNILDYYILPIAYLIYSFIYTKYYNYQIKRNINLESVLNYNMYKFFFNRNNPSIKKVNVFFYKKFQEESEKDINENIISFDKIKIEKETIIKFLDYISSEIVKKNNYKDQIKKYEEVKDNFKDCISLLNKIIIELNQITSITVDKYDKIANQISETIFDPIAATVLAQQRPLNNILNKSGSLKNELNINNLTPNTLEIKTKPPIKTIIIKPTSNFLDIFNKIKNSIKKTLKIEKIDKEKYEKAFQFYLLILNKIQTINKSLIKENFIKEEDISLYDIFKNYNKYNKEFEKYVSKKKEQDDLLKFISEIKNYTEDQVEVYNLFFDLFKNKNNINKNNINKKKKDYFDEIKEMDTKICENIEKSLDKINNIIDTRDPIVVGRALSVHIDCPIKNNSDCNDAILNIKKSLKDDNVDFNNFLKLFFISVCITQSKEYNYIEILKDKKITTPNDLKAKKIEDIKFIYNNYFRTYKKKGNNVIKNEMESIKKKINNELSYVQSNKTVSNKENNITKNKTDITALENVINDDNILLKKTINEKTTFDEYKIVSDILLTNIQNILIFDEIKNKLKKIYNGDPNSRVTLARVVLLPPDPTLDPALDVSQLLEEVAKTFVDQRGKSAKTEIIDKINSLIIANPLFDKNTYNNKYIKIIDDLSKKTPPLKLPDNFIYTNITKSNKYLDSRLIDIQTTINQIENRIKANEQRKLEIETLKMLKENNKNLLQKKEDNLNALLLEIDKPTTNSSISSNKDNEKIQFNTLFDSLKDLSINYEDQIDNITYQTSSNKMNSLYKKDKDLCNIIEEINKYNTYTILNIPEIEKTTLNINNYFTKNENIFKDELRTIILKNNIKEIEPFFEEYEKFNDELNEKIRTLLKYINSGIYSIKEKSSIVPPLPRELLVDPQNFLRIIKKQNSFKKKVEKEEKEYSSNLTAKKIKVGKYTKILSYTDNLFIYFIDLLIIIDFLLFFYAI